MVSVGFGTVKPAPFRYFAPNDVEEAVGLLRELGEEAKVLAGGQSLVPAMNFRLARPDALVDIGRVAHGDRAPIRTVRSDDDTVTIGALVRHVELERGAVGGPLGTLLRQAGSVIGHLPIRTRGTFGGSIAHADPASEWCALAALLDAEITLQSAAGQRTVGYDDFFVTVFTTAMEADEILTNVTLPALGPDHRVGFAEFSRRAGDFAIVLAMVVLRLEDARIAEARVALGGVADRPVRASLAEQLLIGAAPSEAAYRAAGDAAAEGVDPAADIHGPPEYRQDLVRAMVRRALARAAEPAA
jgi:carbon-monoxide dehydrogenase medium subunit